MFETKVSGGAAGARQIKGWVREIFVTGEEVTVMVSELTCSEPGCPPVETVIALMDGGRAPRRFKLHMPLAEVRREHIQGLEDAGGAR